MSTAIAQWAHVCACMGPDQARPFKTEADADAHARQEGCLAPQTWHRDEDGYWAWHHDVDPDDPSKWHR